jgi:anti-sigma factor RsiW
MRHEVFAVRHIAEEALEEYAMGHLSPYQSQQLEEHLSSCDEYRDRLAPETEIIRTIKAAGAKLGIRK